MPAPKEVAEPHKEVRFTRSRQGQLYGVAAAVMIGVAVVVTTFALHPERLLPWWSILPPLALGLVLAKFAHYCTAHAYLIFTPLGVEIFPLWKPQDNLHVVFWSEIATAEVDQEQSQLTLHYNDERTAGVVVALGPIRKPRRELVTRTVEGVMEKREKGGGPQTHDPISK